MEEEDSNRPPLNGTDALIELEAATKNVAAALEKSVGEYEELMEKYAALQEMVKNGATTAQANGEPGGYRRHVVVMIDAYDNELTESFLRYAKESIANQKYTLEEALDDWFRRYRPDLEHVHRIVHIYADYGVLFAGPAKSGHNQDVEEPRPLAKLLSTSGICFDFINVTSEEDVIRKMHRLTIDHIRDWDCVGFFYSENRGSHFDAHDKYMAKTTNISAEFATLLRDLAEGKLPSWNPGCSGGEVEQVWEITSNDGVATENETTHRRESHGYFENSRYVARTPPTSDMKSPKVLQRVGLIPLNAAGHRLDHPIRFPTNAEHTALKNRTNKKKLCGSFQLAGYCPVEACRFDHTPISQKALSALRYKLAKWPCRFGSACRRKDCFNGHICSTKGCNGRGGSCKFGKDSHGVDMVVAQWVEPARGWGKPAEGHGNTNGDDQSSKSSTENWPTMGSLIDI